MSGSTRIFGGLTMSTQTHFLFKHVFVEELQAVAVDLHRTPGVAFHQGGEVFLQMRLTEAVGAEIEEFGDTPDGSGVSVDGIGCLALAV